MNNSVAIDMLNYVRDVFWISDLEQDMAYFMELILADHFFLQTDLIESVFLFDTDHTRYIIF